MTTEKAIRIFERDGHTVHSQTVGNSDERRWIVHFNDLPGSPHVIIGKERLIEEAEALRERIARRAD